MSASEILKEIERLSPAEKLFVIERTFKEFLKFNVRHQMTFAAEALEEEYHTNKDLTAFSKIDFEDFYEAK